MTERTRFDLSTTDVPSAWFNIMPDIVGAGIQPLPPLHPGTKEPVGPADLAPLFPEALILQEVSTEQWIDIPGPVLDIYRLWRPTSLHRAVRLEQALQTPAHIYFKYEGTSPAGSHKPNTAIAQAYYNKEAGVRRLATETGAGQWGSALAMACRFFGLDCLVYMVKASFEQKPYRRIFMETFGAEVIPSPSETTQAGKGILAEHPDSTGSLGIAISEAIEVPRRTRTPTTRSAPVSVTFCSTRPSSAWRRRSKWRWRASDRTSWSAASEAGRTTPASRTRSWPGSSAARLPTCGSWPPSRPPARRSRREGSRTTSATRRS
jgi:predicted alternative tryptophan synthase beta-subunit